MWMALNIHINFVSGKTGTNGWNFTVEVYGLEIRDIKWLASRSFY